MFALNIKYFTKMTKCTHIQVKNRFSSISIVKKFKTEREKFNYYQDHPEEVEIALAKGAVKASKIADDVLIRVRQKLGF